MRSSSPWVVLNFASASRFCSLEAILPSSALLRTLSATASDCLLETIVVIFSPLDMEPVDIEYVLWVESTFVGGGGGIPKAR